MLVSLSVASKTTRMSQQQAMRRGGSSEQGQGIKYGDVFAVAGDLAAQPIAPQDAAMMQTAENAVLGHTQQGGPAAAMQSAAAHNERAGILAHDRPSDIPRRQGVTVAETRVPGGRIVTEFVAGQAVGQYASRENPGGVPEGAKITIGEALEAAVLTAGDKPVEQSDAAAIQAAEARATGANVMMPGGIAAQAQAAANANAWATLDEDKTKLRDVLSEATSKLLADKPVGREDAAEVAEAEVRNKPDMATTPGGVGASVAAAARLNQDRQ